MKKKIVFVSSEKGGLGKSTACWTVVDYAMSMGERPYLVEGDPSIADVAARYRGHLDGIEVPLARRDSAGQAVVELFSHLEAVFAVQNTVVVNLPAGAASTVDAMAEELVGPTLEALEVELAVVFLVGPGEESVRSFRESLVGGLCKVADETVLVANEFFGRPEGFAWYRSDLRRDWLTEGNREFTMPRLIPRIADRIRTLPGPLHELAVGRAGDLTIVERAGLVAWMRACEPFAAAALGSTR